MGDAPSPYAARRPRNARATRPACTIRRSGRPVPFAPRCTGGAGAPRGPGVRSGARPAFSGSSAAVRTNLCCRRRIPPLARGPHGFGDTHLAYPVRPPSPAGAGRSRGRRRAHRVLPRVLRHRRRRSPPASGRSPRQAPRSGRGRLRPAQAVGREHPQRADHQHPGRRPVQPPAGAAQRVNGMGTGIVLDPRGYILHNISDRSSRALEGWCVPRPRSLSETVVTCSGSYRRTIDTCPAGLRASSAGAGGVRRRSRGLQGWWRAP